MPLLNPSSCVKMYVPARLHLSRLLPVKHYSLNLSVPPHSRCRPLGAVAAVKPLQPRGARGVQPRVACLLPMGCLTPAAATTYYRPTRSVTIPEWGLSRYGLCLTTSIAVAHPYFAYLPNSPSSPFSLSFSSPLSRPLSIILTL